MSSDTKQLKDEPPIWITGLGLVTPLACGTWPSFRALRAGRTLSDRLKNLPEDVAPVDLVRSVGSVNHVQHAADDPSIELAELAIREACVEAGIAPAGVATFLGTSKGAVVRWCESVERLRSRGQEALSERWFGPTVHGPQGWLSHRLTVRLGVAVKSHAVAACASSLVALHFARQALLAGECNTAIVATSEAALHPYFIHSYRRLGVLAPTRADAYFHRPFDQRRAGFRLAEMSAAIVLQRELNPQQQNKKTAQQPLQLKRTAMANESYDMIRPDPKMPALMHLANQLIGNEPIAGLHPHAPGTQDHDARELEVLLDAVESRSQTASPPAVYAAKGALGHGLGASGLVSLVLAGLSIRTRSMLPMPWLEEPMVNMVGRVPCGADRATSIHAGSHVITASGFGGHIAGAIIAGHD